MARNRTTKKLAQRIDLNYFKRPTPLKRAKFWLSLFLPSVAFVWIAVVAVHKDSRVFSSGRMSQPHAILEKECSSCHIAQNAGFSAKAEDTACRDCHDGPAHHESRIPAPKCAECHTEHRGHINIAAVSDKACAACHASLESSKENPRVFAHINDFSKNHPEFSVFREHQRDPGTIKLNHALHMKLIRRGPNGPGVQLDCGDCHRPSAAKNNWKYSDAKYLSGQSTSPPSPNLATPSSTAFAPHDPQGGRALMTPVKFANACASCHLLTFDKRFDEGVPHDQPEIVHAFLLRKFSAYIAAHPSELREARDPERDLTGKPVLPLARVLTSAQWIALRTSDAEQLLWRKTCLQCHTLGHSGNLIASNVAEINYSPAVSLPQIAPARLTVRWLPHAKFDHDAHGGFACASCHQKALSSTESSDVLLPGISTCQACHAPGPDHAESRCFECHTYHDWSNRKEITPRFTLPALKTGGR